MADKVVTLHPQNQTDDNLYPRVLGKSVQAGTNIEIDPTANTISVAQSLVDTINGKQNTIPETGSSIEPVYFSKDGQVAKASLYAGGTKVTLNGTSKGSSSVSLYAPTSNGTAGYVLVSGEAANVPPKWVAPSSISFGYVAQNVNTGTFDPTSDNPAGQKSIAERNIDLSKVVDSKGRPRFIQGTSNIVGIDPDKGTITYSKWSLSGTHLMAVISGSLKANVTVHNGHMLGHFVLPKWVVDKIVPIWSGSYVEAKNISLKGNNWTEKDVRSVLTKDDSSVYIVLSQDFTNDSTERYFRIQYDLLIDAD